MERPKIFNHEENYVPKRIIVPFNGSDESLTGLEFACKNFPKDSISLVYVVEVRMGLHLAADMLEEANYGDGILTFGQDTAKGFGVKIPSLRYRTELLQARTAAHGIIDDAFETNADAIILGAKYKSSFKPKND